MLTNQVPAKSMPPHPKFKLKKVQIEQFLKREFDRAFRGGGRISLRKRQRFMERIARKVGQRFGKDVLCLVDFTRKGFQTLVSPSHSESTPKGRLSHSFLFPQVAYTTHCIDRFSERTQTTENCIIALDHYLEEALLTFGLHDGHLVCRAGVFAYEMENERLIIKTFINAELLSGRQIRDFYGWDVVAGISPEQITDNLEESDFILQDEGDLPPGPGRS